MRKEEQT